MAGLASARLEKDAAAVPHLWHLEVRNGLLVAARRGRPTAEGPTECLNALRDLPVRTDMDPDLTLAIVLAEKHGFLLYDAIYLELAKRHAMPIATLDRALARTADAEGLTPICDVTP